MKKFVSLLLAAVMLATMLCVFAVPASAEEEPTVIEPVSEINIPEAGNYIIKGGSYTLYESQTRSPNCVLTIPKDTVVTVSSAFNNDGTIYVYGTLIVNSKNAYNGGTIYVYCGGKFEGTITNGREVVQGDHDFGADGLCKNCGAPKRTTLSGNVWYQLTENDTVLPNGSTGLTLTIGGEGPMPNISNRETRPWDNDVDKITAIVIDPGVTFIGTFAFLNSNKVTTLTIPENVTYIGLYAFAGCTSLKEVTIPESVESIGENAFSGCSNLVIHGISGTAAEQYAKENGVGFKNCGSVDPEKHLHIYANGVCSCGESEPDDGSILSGDVWYKLTENDTELPNGDTGLTLTIGGEGEMPNFPSLEDRPWHNVAGNITAVEINSGVTGIGANAFFECGSLQKVTIPGSVTRIGTDAFVGCDPNLVIHGTSGTAAEQYAKENDIDFFENGECKHFARFTCDACNTHLTKSELLQMWNSNGATGSTLSEGSLVIVVGVAAAVVFGLGGFILGTKKKKKPAVADEE